MTRPLALLRDDGTLARGARCPLGDEALLSLHDHLVTARALDRVARELVNRGDLPFHVAAGGEDGAAIAATMALLPGDWIVPTHRGLAVLLARGVPPAELGAHLAGRSPGGASLPGQPGSRERRVLDGSPLAGTQIAQGTGLALGMQRRGDPNVCLTFLGDSATASNDFHAGLNFAGVFGAPVIFACWHHEAGPHLHPGPGVPPEEQAVAYGIAAQLVDGDDVLAVAAAVQSAAARARQGGGPALLELVVGRRDPLQLLESLLLERGLRTRETLESLHGQREQEIAAAAALAAHLPAPTGDAIFDHVTALGSEQRAEQRRRYPGRPPAAPAGGSGAGASEPAASDVDDDPNHNLPL